MYGQMTAGSWIYIGTQGIVQGTYETFVEAGRQHYGGNLKGKWILTAGLGGMGGAQPLAAVLAGACSLTIECQQTASISACAPATSTSRPRPRRGAGADRALHQGREAMSIGLFGNAADIVPELVRRGIRPDMVTDQTSAHDQRVRSSACRASTGAERCAVDGADVHQPRRPIGLRAAVPVLLLRRGQPSDGALDHHRRARWVPANAAAALACSASSQPDEPLQRGQSHRLDGHAQQALGLGPYRLISVPDFDAAVKTAARALAETGKPVGLVVWAGHHAWLMTGFEATGDPRLADARVTGVRVMDPLYPHESKWGRAPAPNRLIGLDALGRQFVRRHRPDYDLARPVRLVAHPPGGLTLAESMARTSARDRLARASTTTSTP